MSWSTAGDDGSATVPCEGPDIQAQFVRCSCLTAPSNDELEETFDTIPGSSGAENRHRPLHSCPSRRALCARSRSRLPVDCILLTESVSSCLTHYVRLWSCRPSLLVTAGPEGCGWVPEAGMLNQAVGHPGLQWESPQGHELLVP